MKTVLVIDDNPIMCRLIKDLLETEDFRAITTNQGETGLKLAEENLPDVILCDINMPKMDGYTVLSLLQENESTRTIPFIFLTAETDKSSIRQGMNLGADDYLTKPVDLEELLSAINSRLTKQGAVLTQSQQQLNQLRSSIALSLPHELRTPLTSVLTSVELLRMLADTGAETSEFLEIADTIQTATQKLHRLVQNFLLYTQLEIAAHDPGNSGPTTEDVTLNCEVAISRVAINLANQFDRSLDLRLKLQNAAIAFSMIDLEKVITELLDNAFKFSKPETLIEVSSWAEDNHYHLQITDRGRGLTPEQIHRLSAYVQFDRKFYEQSGVGLGFAIAKRLVEQKGGQLTIQSIPKKLTTVHVSFPMLID